MALTSPGVQVTVIDESFYTPAEPGTTPLIVVATAQDKINAAGTGVAAATSKANAGRAFRLTGQRDLVDLFGVPFFEQAVGGTPVHGGERNEYGLLAAYSYLGVSNSAFVVRADVDLAQLEGQAREPGANPRDGQWWVDTASTAWGIQEWNAAAGTTVGGQRFANKIPLVLTNDDATRIENSGAPKASVGAIGDYAVVFEVDAASDPIKDTAVIYYKSAGGGLADGSLVQPGEWVLLGSNKWAASHPTVVGNTAEDEGFTAGNFTINSVNVSVGAGDSLEDLVAEINGRQVSGVYAKANNGRLYLYSSGATDENGTPGDSSGSNVIVIANDGEIEVAADLKEIGIEVGTYYGPALQLSPHTSVPQWKLTNDESRPTGSVWIKTTEPNNGARWRARQWNAATESWVQVDAPLYSSTHASLYALDRTGGGANIPVGSLIVQYNSDENSGFDLTPATAKFKVWRRAATGRTIIKSVVVPFDSIPYTDISFTIAESRIGQAELSAVTVGPFDIAVTSAVDAADDIAAAINAARLLNVEAAVTVSGELEIFHKLGGDFRLTNGTNNIIPSLFGSSENRYNAPEGAVDADHIASNWQPLIVSGEFDASDNAPLSQPQDGQLWYNPEFSDVDIMVHDGSSWRGYKNIFPQAEIIVSATAPTASASERELGDLWISTADLENFPTIYRWNNDSKEWTMLDKTDQVSEDGVLFADARYGESGALGDVAAEIASLRTNDYVDPDAPDPALYPQGMLLWNTRRSGGNVKRYVRNYIDVTADNVRFGSDGGEKMAAYAVDRWVTASGNNEDGSGSFGRKAQRKVVVQALKSAVDTSQEIRDEERRNFNLIAAPGYPELLSNLINLNLDRGITAFVVGDVPFRLPSDATSLIRWGTNENLAFDNGDEGLVSFDEYAAVFYPSGFTTDLSGANAVVPSSHMMLRTIALSDNVSYPWFAPAGTRRGGITNATSVGYIDSETGEFRTVALNEGTRDVLYDLKVNPITFFNGVGLVNYGQKTRARNASALDRVNVARLTVYLRSQLNKLARPYIFEPNDKITRDEVKQAVESLLLELVGLRAIYDFAVVCDESNNTPTRVDRNELWVDIAIEPVKAVEFIYIPLRVKNTGEI